MLHKIITIWTISIIALLGACADDANNTPDRVVTPTEEESIAKAKAMTADTRTWLNSFANLDDPTQATNVDHETIAAVYNEDSLVIAQLIADTSSVLTNMLPDTTAESISAGNYTLPINSCTGETCRSGEIQVTIETTTFITAHISGMLDDESEINLHYTSNIPEAAVSGSPFTSDSLQLTLTGSASSGVSSIELNGLSISLEYDAPTEFPSHETLMGINRILYKGDASVLSNGFGFRGSMLMSVVALKNHPDSIAQNSLEQISYGGEFFGNGHRFSASSDFKLNNAQHFDFVGLKLYQSAGEKYIYRKTKEEDTYGALEYVRIQYDWTNLHLVTYTNIPNQSENSLFYIPHQTCFIGYNTSSAAEAVQCVDGDALHIEREILLQNPQSTGVNGVTYIYGTTSSYTYPLEENTSILIASLSGPFESEEYFADMSTSLTFDIDLANYPAAIATFFGNRDSFQGGNIGLTLSYNNQSLTIKYIRENIETEGNGLIEITNQDNVRLLIRENAGQRSGTIIVDGNLIGSIEETSEGLLMIRYSDGTFETLQ